MDKKPKSEAMDRITAKMLKTCDARPNTLQQPYVQDSCSARSNSEYIDHQEILKLKQNDWAQCSDASRHIQRGSSESDNSNSEASEDAADHKSKECKRRVRAVLTHEQVPFRLEFSFCSARNERT
jgi:hypothetical protein